MLTAISKEHVSLYRKLHNIMKEIERIPKNGWNAHHKYNYVAEADLVEHMRKLFNENGVLPWFHVKEHTREGAIGTADCEITLIDVETGASLSSVVAGEGADKGDKAMYKAYTGAMKYFLMKTFLVPTGDDPEGDTETDEWAEERAEQIKELLRSFSDYGISRDKMLERLRDEDLEPQDPKDYDKIVRTLKKWLKALEESEETA